MKKLFNILAYIYKTFVSVKLAVFTLSALAVLTALGTVVESRYDQEMANKLIYHSFWMTGVIGLLSVNLLMVLIDRWPWKKRHIPFILAHIGILILISGALLSRYFGVDGSLRFKEGEKASLLSVSDMEIKIYSSYDGENFTLIYEEPVDMFFKKPTGKKPYVISAAGESFIVNQYLPFAVGRKVFKPSIKGGGPAVRFHWDGSQASFVEWMHLELGEDTLNRPFGPVRLSLTKDKNYQPRHKRELILWVKGEKLFYSLVGERKSSSGRTSQRSPYKELNTGQVFKTGWMDFEFRLLEFFPKSRREFVFEAKDKPSEMTLKAIHVSYLDQSVWLGQNSYAQFFKKDRVYVMSYLNKTIPLGFDLKLIDFKQTNYQGSFKAKSYESKVQLEGKTHIISMNEPLKHKGFTFYQSSFEAGEEGGEAIVSILSVGKDPGRILKYFGSSLIVAGVALLFYRRKIKFG